MADNFATQGGNVRALYSRNSEHHGSTRQQTKEHIMDDVKRALKHAESPLSDFKREVFRFKETKESLEDLNTFELYHELSRYYAKRENTYTLKDMFTALSDLIVTDINIYNGEKQVTELVSINNDITYIPDVDDITEIATYNNIYNEFMIMPYYDEHDNLRLNCVHSDRYIYSDDSYITLIERFGGQFVVTKYFRYKDEFDAIKSYKVMMSYKWDKRKRKYIAYETYEEEYDYKLFPIVITDTNKVMSDAIKTQALNLSDLRTSLRKEILVNTATLVINQDATKHDSFDMFDSATIRINPRSVKLENENTGKPYEVISGSMRYQEFDGMENIIMNNLSNQIRLDVSDLGLAPSNTAVAREQRRTASRINGLQKTINNILDDVAKQLTQNLDATIVLKPMEELNELQVVEREKEKVAIGASTEYLTAKRLNSDLTDDEIWEIALTNIIRNGKMMTKKERDKAIELGLEVESMATGEDY